MININQKIDLELLRGVENGDLRCVRGHLELLEGLRLGRISQHDFALGLIRSLSFQAGNLTYMEKFFFKEMLDDAVKFVQDGDSRGELLDFDDRQIAKYFGMVRMAASFTDASTMLFPLRKGNLAGELIQTGRTILLGNSEVGLQYRVLDEDLSPQDGTTEEVHFAEETRPSEISEWWSETLIPTDDIERRGDAAYAPSGVLVLARRGEELLVSNHGLTLEVLNTSHCLSMSVKSFHLNLSDVRDPRVRKA